MPPVTNPSSAARLEVWTRLAGFFKPYRWRIAFALAALLIAAGATLTLPLAVRQIVDQQVFSKQTLLVDYYFLSLFGIVLIIAAASAMRFYLVMWLGERIVADIRSAVFDHVLRLDPVFFEVTRTGEVLSRLTTDTTQVQAAAGAGFSIALRMLVMLSGSLIMMTVTSPRLTGLIVLLVPVVILPLLVYGRRVRRLSRISQDNIAQASAIAGETLDAMQTVQAFVLEKHFAGKFSRTVETAFDSARLRLKARALLSAFALLIIFSAIILVIWVGVQFVIAGKMSMGELSQFLIFAFIVATSSAALSEVWGDMQKAAGAMERLLELLSAESSLVTPDPPALVQLPADAHLHLQGIHFHYPSRPDRHALKNFTLTIAPGETVALVGPSGAGKSTIFHLLLRFYDPQQGKISLGAVDIATLPLQQLRRHIGIVPQETVIFSDDVQENIRCGKLAADIGQIRAAAKAAEADRFIQQLPEQYHTFLGEKGTRLSGGQKQRIAIARAILKSPQILLLDEATSSLDAESEQLVQEAMQRLMQGRTTLIIAHRLATVKNADRIIVMDQGQIVAAGRHRELLAAGGLYARLAQLQFAGI